ncbi:MAG TPA: SIS domain-containing protein [Chloroflexota bacterium]|nr:SIS domain-containing protein [Chloroflexota bacterium]
MIEFDQADREVSVEIEADIRSTPDIVRQALNVVAQDERVASLLSGEVLFLGSGSSHCIGLAAARLYEDARGLPAQALLPSEYRPRPGWTHVATSRTGQTTELIRAMQAAKETGARVILVVGDAGSPAERWADAVLPLPFASETGVVQTRFITAALTALRALITSEDLSELPEAVERGLSFQPEEFEQPHVVYLGRGWRYGLARSAALTLQEAALQVPESHQTLDYRHGPIAAADENTLIWSFDAPEDEVAASVLRDAAATGATIRPSPDDPLVSLVQAQLFAAHRAAAQGIDVASPRNLTRAVVLPNR